MSPVSIIFALIAGLLLMQPLHAQQAGAKTTQAIHREIFARQVAACFGMKLDRIEIHDTPLVTEGLSAFSATDKQSGKTIVKGFAGRDQGAAFIGWSADKVGLIGGRAELEPLLKACHALEPRKRFNASGMAARLLWCLGESRHGVTGQLYDAKLVKATGWAALKDAEPRWLHPKAGAALLFHTMTQGRTGSWDYHRVTVSILPDYQIQVNREEVRP